MDLSGLKNDALAAWIPFDDDTEVLISYVSREDLRQLRRQAASVRFVKHRKTETTDPGEADRLLGRAAVKDWRALPGRPGFTMGGARYPYSPENCDFLMAKYNEFANFVNERAIGFSNFVEEEKEEETKNSLDTSGHE
jgi:hypothetical protein